MAIIKAVTVGSIGEEIGIQPGDDLLAINGKLIRDILDYEFYAQDDKLEVEIKKPNGEVWSIEIKKDYDENLGFEFEGIIFDNMQRCKNRCLFCFVDQLPRHMRPSLYIKDDDYRYSFLYGNFITLTNLQESDWQKIETMRLSPLYVSVHCLQPELRAKMLGNPRAAEINHHLERLQQAGIQLHTQIVLCPGFNDGDVLKETINGLARLDSTVISVGIVPVGLTGYRQGLPVLRPVKAEEAKALIAMINNYQQLFRPAMGRGFVYLADEFYLNAGEDFPAAEYYDDYCQIENGIGLARVLLDDFAVLEPSLPAAVDPAEVYLVTGCSALPILQRVTNRLNRIKGLTVSVIPVSNSFFGGNVSVTGLLTGNDIIAALDSNYQGKTVIVPEVIFREGQNILLDNVDLQEIEAASGAQLVTVDGSAAALVKAILNH